MWRYAQSAGSGSLARVLVEQAAEARTADDLADRMAEPVFAQRCPQAKASVRSRLVVMLDVFAQDPQEMALASDKQPVQRLATCRSDPPFAHRVGTGRPVWGDRQAHAFGTEDLIKAGHELAVAIVDHQLELDVAELPAQVACLLDNPGCGRVLGAAGQEDAAGVQLDEYEYAKLLEPDRVNGVMPSP